MTGGLDDLTIVVKTFMRPTILHRFVETAAAAWPGVRTIVLDDSPEPDRVRPDERFTLLVTEHNIGVSEGRNRLCDAVETPLVAVFDDDCLVGPEARLDLLANIVRGGACDLVAGSIREREGYWNGGWVYQRRGTVLEKQHRAHCMTELTIDTDRVELYRVDQVNNAFVARADFVRNVRWDPHLKLREHDDFALRSSAAGEICYTPQATIDHHPHRPDAYDRYRSDTGQYSRHFLEKWGLTTVRKEPEWFVHSPTVPRPRTSP